MACGAGSWGCAGAASRQWTRLHRVHRGPRARPVSVSSPRLASFPTHLSSLSLFYRWWFDLILSLPLHSTAARQPPPESCSAPSEISSSSSVGSVGMSDNEKESAAATEGGASRGADWEVVTLTASAYAAAPGPGGGPALENTGKDGQGSSNALLMSDHFVFPPSEHENLPVETGLQEPEQGVQEESTSVEDAGFNSVVGAGSERVMYYDEGKNMTADEAEMLGDVAEHGSFDDGRGSVIRDDVDDPKDKSDASPDSKSRGSGGAPCQCWLKKHMSCLYDQAKETNALWSVVVAAAFVGFVILWRKDKLHISCLKWRSSSAVR